MSSAKKFKAVKEEEIQHSKKEKALLDALTKDKPDKQSSDSNLHIEEGVESPRETTQGEQREVASFVDSVTQDMQRLRPDLTVNEIKAAAYGLLD